MIPDVYLQGLTKIYTRIKDTPIHWAVTGSLNMALQGLPVAIHDIDLQTDKDGAYNLEQAMAEFVVTPVYYRATDCIRSHYGALNIDGIQVEIMGDIQKLMENQAWEDPVRIELYRKWVSIAGMSIPVLSLDYEYQAYLMMGRREKAELLKAWLYKAES